MTCRRSQVRVLYRPLEIKTRNFGSGFLFQTASQRRPVRGLYCCAAEALPAAETAEAEQGPRSGFCKRPPRRAAKISKRNPAHLKQKIPELRFRVLLLQQRCAERISVRRTAKGPRLFSPGPFALVPVVGVEPTRVISTRDFESPSSAIPTHRLIVYVIITYLAGKIKRKVSLDPNSPAQRAAAAQTGAAGGDSAF